jgi:Uma2 family endonuclease
MKAVIVDPTRTLPDERQRRALGHVNGSVVDVPQWLLDERHAKDIDRADELWEGVLHMVPPPLGEHSDIQSELIVLFHRAGRARGLVARCEIGIFNHRHDYRVPDAAVVRAEHRIREGLRGAELVLEVRSPLDETDRKLDWYIARGVSEILIVDRDSRAVELYVGRDGKALPVPPDDDGCVDLATVGLRLGPVDSAEGRRLRVTGDGIDELV